MNNPWSHDERSRDERALGDLLRQEARAVQAEFSEPLHQNICQAVRQLKADEISLEHSSRGRARPRLAGLAVAAVVVLAAVFAWRNGNPAKVPQHAAPPAPVASPMTMAHLPGAPSLPGMMDRAAIEVDRLISDKLVVEQWAYLEHDARLLANALTGGSLRRFVQPAGSEREPNRTEKKGISPIF
jgi:hypothetical protein